MSTLMSFILDSLQPRLNDPANTKLWLPRLLTEMSDEGGNPLLPIRSKEQDLGFLNGEHGDYIAGLFANSWSIFNSRYAIVDPDLPNPALLLSDVSLVGLQNIWVEQASSQPVTQGYDIQAKFVPNHYPDPTQGLEMPPLTLKGRYRIAQALWVEPTDTEEGRKESITGTGAFTAVFSNCVLNAPLTLETVDSAEPRSTLVTLRNLSLDAMTDERPKLTFDDLTLEDGLEDEDALIMYIKMALNEADGQVSMLDTVASMLNKPDNLVSISAELTEHLNASLDGLFGVLPAQGLPDDSDHQQGATPLDVYFFDRLRVALNEPGNDWYLPLLLRNSSDPVLEPYTNPHIVIPDQEQSGLDYTDIQLNNLSLTGLSNAFIPLDTSVLTSPDIAVVIDFGVLPEGSAALPPAPPLTMQSHFSLVQQGIEPLPLKGLVTASLLESHMQLDLALGGNNVSDLEIIVSEVVFLWETGLVEMTVTLEPRDTYLEQVIKKVLDKEQVHTTIKTHLMEALAKQKNELSANFTRLVRTVLQNKLN